MNSIPKSGTHLLRRCLALMPGMMYSGIHINRVRYNQYQDIYAREQLLTRFGRGVLCRAICCFRIMTGRHYKNGSTSLY